MIRLHLSHRCNIGLLLTYYLISKLKEKKNVFIPIDAEKALEKFNIHSH